MGDAVRISADEAAKLKARIAKRSIELRGCRIWTGSRNPRGYGEVYFKPPGSTSSHRCYGAHRMAYLAEHLEIPDGLFVCHRCDVRECVKVEHLFLGTNAENFKDAEQKYRVPKRATSMTCAQHGCSEPRIYRLPGQGFRSSKFCKHHQHRANRCNPLPGVDRFRLAPPSYR